MMKNKLYISVIKSLSCAILLFMTGCREQKPIDFSFRYTMESVNNYKMILIFGSDKSYTIEEHNYFMDNHAGTYNPVVRQGTLTDSELEEIRTLLTACRFFKMKDAYGFDVPDNTTLGNIIYQIDYVADGKEKMISIRSSPLLQLPKSYSELLIYISLFLKNHA